MFNQNQATYNDFTILRTLSHQKPKLKLAIDSNRDVYALKFIEQQPLSGQELDQILNLNHPNIAKLHQYVNIGTYVKKNRQSIQRQALKYEYIKCGEVYEYIEQTGTFNEMQCRCYFKQIVDALLYLHGQGIVHNNLSLENVLFDDPQHIKITDIGLSLFKKPKQSGYTTPEFNKDGPYNNNQQDVFAAGVILFIMMIGRPPFALATGKDSNFAYFVKNQQQIFWNRIRNQYQKQSSKLTEEFTTLIDGIFALDPAHRLTLSAIKNHPWMEGLAEPFSQNLIDDFNARKDKILMQMRTRSLLQERQRLQMIVSQERKGLREPMGKFRSQPNASIPEIQRELRLQGNKPEMRYDLQVQCNDANQLLRIIIENEKELGGFIYDLSKQFYKLRVRYQEDQRSDVEVQIEFLKINEETLNLEFSKIGGDQQEFYIRVHSFHQFILNRYN